MDTPFFQYDWQLLEDTILAAQDSASRRNYHLHFAIKANNNMKVLKKMKKYNLGADCVSGNEIAHAIQCGMLPKDIVFAGVGKTDEEIEYAIQQDIFCFHVESFQELEVINSIASSYNKVVKVALRLNPNITANTHEKITTGKSENKFGFQQTEIELFFDRYFNLNNINFIGLHFHIGSQITDMTVFQNLCKMVNLWVQVFDEKGFNLQYLNLGGGLGVNYDNPDEQLIPDFESYFNTIEQNLKINKNIEVHFEPGRALVANCAQLITKVLYTKIGTINNFVIVDAGMTEFLRPALYDAYHKIETLHDHSEKENYTIAGPICESSDCFGKNIDLPKLERGDYLKIRSVGAYGESMQLIYNMKNIVSDALQQNTEKKSIVLRLLN